MYNFFFYIYFHSFYLVLANETPGNSGLRKLVDNKFESKLVLK